MLPKGADREDVLPVLDDVGGLRPGSSEEVRKRTGVPAADVYGAATFYSLLRDPDAGIRVCQGLSCRLDGVAGELKRELDAAGMASTYCSCLGRCDDAPASWDPDGAEPLIETGLTPSHPELVIDLAAGGGPEEEVAYDALRKVGDKGPEWLLDELEASGLTGRGGAGFPAHIKWRGIRDQVETERYVVLNADEGEPGTFKDRECMLRRPHLVVEGLAIAAEVLEADDVYVYVRGEFRRPGRSLEEAVEAARERGDLGELPRWHFVEGHGAYICGEETALLESLEGKRGMPRMKPPFPVEKGFRDKPTLIQNVETIACLPFIVHRGGETFRDLGATQAGTKLYCLSGHVERPGVYEAPMGTSMAELLQMAGGTKGTLKAFSPGGASSGFLPASKVDVAMDFKALQEAGSMLGSAGVVVLNDTVDMVEAALTQAVFFEDESCGQCSPCRIGTQMVRQALERYGESKDPGVLGHLEEVSWGMKEASICGLGQAAALPLLSAMEYFPDEFGIDR